MVKKILYTFLCLLMIGCNNTIKKQYLTTKEFEKEYKESKILHSMKAYKFLFIKNKFIFLQKKEMSLSNKNKWKEKILYTEFNNLNTQIQEEILIELKK